MSKLTSLLANCQVLLRSVDEEYWTNKIKKISEGSSNGFDNILLGEMSSWCRAMGSFNDSLISELNGHILGGRNEKQLHSKLEEIRAEIYTKLNQIDE